MSYLFAGHAVLGPGRTGLPVGYKVVNHASGVVLTAFTTTGVTETTVPGNYGAEIPLPDDLRVRVVWGTDGNDWSEETVDPAFRNTLGSGQYSWEVTVTDTDAAPVVGAIVTLQNEAGTANVAWGVADAAGQVTFSVNAGTYRLLLSAGSLYEPFTPVSVAVAANREDTYELTRQAVDPPATPGLCAILFTVHKNGTALPHAKVRATLVGPNQAASDVLLATQVTEALTDASGQATLQLVRQDAFVKGQGLYDLEVLNPKGGSLYKLRAAVPNASSANAEDLLPADA